MFYQWRYFSCQIAFCSTAAVKFSNQFFCDHIAFNIWVPKCNIFEYTLPFVQQLLESRSGSGWCRWTGLGAAGGLEGGPRGFTWWEGEKDWGGGFLQKKDNGLDSLYTVAAPRRLLEQVCHDLYRWIAKHIDPVSKCYGFLFEYQSGNRPIV